MTTTSVFAKAVAELGEPQAVAAMDLAKELARVIDRHPPKVGVAAVALLSAVLLENAARVDPSRN